MRRKTREQKKKKKKRRKRRKRNAAQQTRIQTDPKKMRGPQGLTKGRAEMRKGQWAIGQNKRQRPKLQQVGHSAYKFEVPST